MLVAWKRYRTNRRAIPFTLGIPELAMAGYIFVSLVSIALQNRDPLATAYLLYASGRYALARSTEPSLVLGIGYFEKAIERDPQFALAYEGLANCYMILGVFGMRAPAETLPRARDAVLKALQIEPRLAGAYGTLGHIKMQYDRDWAGAETDFARAVAIIGDHRFSIGQCLWKCASEALSR